MKNSMKKMMCMMCMLVLTAAAYADDDRPVGVNELPTTAQQFLAQHFRGVTVSYAKVEDERFGRSYEVVFVDGNKVEFRGNGEWKEVDCRYGQVPDAVVPRTILDYVRRQYTGGKIRKIEWDRHGYEVKLTGGLKLKFDRNGVLRPRHSKHGRRDRSFRQRDGRSREISSLKKRDSEHLSGKYGSKKRDSERLSGKYGSKKRDSERLSGKYGPQKRDFDRRSEKDGRKKRGFDRSSKMNS